MVWGGESRSPLHCTLTPVSKRIINGDERERPVDQLPRFQRAHTRHTVFRELRDHSTILSRDLSSPLSHIHTYMKNGPFSLFFSLLSRPLKPVPVSHGLSVLPVLLVCCEQWLIKKVYLEFFSQYIFDFLIKRKKKNSRCTCLCVRTLAVQKNAVECMSRKNAFC